MTDHPMQPTPEQYGEWLAEARRLHPIAHFVDIARHVGGLAYAAGADAELDACCEWLEKAPFQSPTRGQVAGVLRAARRPKPPSLKQRALADLDTIQTHGGVTLTSDRGGYQIADLSNIRRAIEALPDADFLEIDPWADAVAVYLKCAQREQALPVTVPKVLDSLGVPTDKQTNQTANRVRQIAEQLGWVHARRRHQGGQAMGLWPPSDPATPATYRRTGAPGRRGP